MLQAEYIYTVLNPYEQTPVIPRQDIYHEAMAKCIKDRGNL